MTNLLSYLKMILFTPLDIPKIQPNNWDEWWEFWNKEIAPPTNSASVAPLWKIVDLYSIKNTQTSTHEYSVVNDLIEQVHKHCIFEPTLIRVMENLQTIKPHSDNIGSTKEFRSVLWNTYTDPLWTFTYNKQSKKLILPELTNSFYFLDYPMTHDAVYQPGQTKGLLIVYGRLKKNTEQVLTASAEKYKQFACVV